jgi:oligoendopeptidase F
MAEKSKSKTKNATDAATENGAAPEQDRKPSDQALQVVDVAVGAVPEAADAVTKTVEQLRDSEGRSQELKALQNLVSNLRDSNTRDAQLETLKQGLFDEIEKAETRGGEIRRQVTDQIVEQAKKAREQLEPVYRDRVEPVYKDRVEPTVKKVAERV